MNFEQWKEEFQRLVSELPAGSSVTPLESELQDFFNRGLTPAEAIGVVKSGRTAGSAASQFADRLATQFNSSSLAPADPRWLAILQKLFIFSGYAIWCVGALFAIITTLATLSFSQQVPFGGAVIQQNMLSLLIGFVLEVVVTAVSGGFLVFLGHLIPILVSLQENTDRMANK